MWLTEIQPTLFSRWALFPFETNEISEERPDGENGFAAVPPRGCSSHAEGADPAGDPHGRFPAA